MFLMVFFSTVKCQCKFLFQIKFPHNRCLVTSWDTGIHHIHFLVFRVNVSGNGYLICTFISIINWFNLSDLLDVYKILR